MRRGRQQRGLTMVELMVALVINAVIVLAGYQVFIANNQSYRMSAAISRLQEDGRSARLLVASEIRRADYWGCGGGSTDVKNHVNSDGGDGYDFGQGGLTGQENGDGPDSFTIRGGVPGSNTEVELAGNVNPNSAQIKIEGGDIEEGQILALSDCSTAEVFQVTNINKRDGKADVVVHNKGKGDPGNATKKLQKSYAEDAQLIDSETVRFFVQDAPDGTSSLYRAVNGEDQLLVKGVSDLEIRYAEDTNGDRSTDRWVDADQVGDWERVHALRVSMLLQSEKTGVTDEPTPYTFAGQTVTPGDNRLRSVFTVTEVLRNRNVQEK